MFLSCTVGSCPKIHSHSFTSTAAPAASLTPPPRAAQRQRVAISATHPPILVVQGTRVRSMPQQAAKALRVSCAPRRRVGRAALLEHEHSRITPALVPDRGWGRRLTARSKARALASMSNSKALLRAARTRAATRACAPTPRPCVAPRPDASVSPTPAPPARAADAASARASAAKSRVVRAMSSGAPRATMSDAASRDTILRRGSVTSGTPARVESTPVSSITYALYKLPPAARPAAASDPRRLGRRGRAGRAPAQSTSQAVVMEL